MVFSVNNTDAIHIYSERNEIWLQLRRDIPTQENIGEPSFKSSFRLTSNQAIAIAGELLTAATYHQNTRPIKPDQSTTPPGAPVNHGKPWTVEEDQKLTSAFDARASIPELAKAHQRGIGGIQSRLTKLGKLALDQHKTFPTELK
jgi:hypothetical protein